MTESTNYVAFDGLTFENKEKCLTYEYDAINILFEQYFNTIDYLETDEFELFDGFGSEDNLIDIVNIKSTKDLLIILGISLYFIDEAGYVDDVKEKKIEDAWNFEYCLRDVELVSTRAIKEMPENIKERCLAYVRDVINENISPSGKKVKSIDGRRSFSEKLLGKNSIREFREGFFHNLTHSISRLKGTPYISKIYQLYEAGFPQEVDIKAQKTANETTRREIYSLFDQKREDALRTEMLKRYASERIKGAMQLKYYNETGDVSIFLNEKEQAEFEKMSFAELKEKYDTELVTTHKGAALATLKLHQEKKTGGNLAQSLEEYNGLINKAKSDVNFDMNIRRYIFDEIKKDYQKFAPNDKAYKDIVENLAPAKYEIATINEYVKVIKEKR